VAQRRRRKRAAEKRRRCRVELNENLTGGINLTNRFKRVRSTSARQEEAEKPAFGPAFLPILPPSVVISPRGDRSAARRLTLFPGRKSLFVVALFIGMLRCIPRGAPRLRSSGHPLPLGGRRATSFKNLSLSLSLFLTR